MIDSSPEWTWVHCVLELYPPQSGEWPKTGTPADWIEDGSVGWCNGREEDLVQFIPLWRIVWWKAKRRVVDIKDYLIYLLGFINGENARIEKRFREMMEREDD